MNVIERIEDIRNSRGMSVNKLAKEALMSQSTIASILKRDASMTIETLQSVCNGLGLTLSQFFLNGEKYEFVTAQEKIMLDHFRKLTPEKRRAIIELLVD